MSEQPTTFEPNYEQRALLHRAAMDPEVDTGERVEAAARLFLNEFDRYFGNDGKGARHPKFFDESVLALRMALRAAE